MDNLNLTTSAIADRQRPISAVFEQPRSAKQWEQYVLPAWQISFFEKNGFLNGIKIMTDPQAQKLGQRLFALQSRIKSSSNGHQPGGALATKDAFPNRAGSLKVLPEYIDMICSPAYRMATYQLLGGPFQVLQDKLYCSRSPDSGNNSWHQDYSYGASTRPMHHLSCWIALEDASADNSCLYYIPGSHKWGLLPITSATQNMNAVKEVLTTEQLEAYDYKVANILPRGFASFHHPLMLHGSYVNPKRPAASAVMIDAMDHQSRPNIRVFDHSLVLDSFCQLAQHQLSDKMSNPLLFHQDETLRYFAADIPKVNVEKLYGGCFTN